MISMLQFIKLIMILTVMAITVAVSGCNDNSEQIVIPASSSQSTTENQTPLLNETVMGSILPDDLPGEWEYKPNYVDQGTLTMIVTRPGYKSVITIQDKRSEELARYAVTPENFSYSQSSIQWEFSETRFKNSPAISGTYVVNNTVQGELIAYPQDRFLVIAYIVGENCKIVDMLDLLDSLEFPS